MGSIEKKLIKALNSSKKEEVEGSLSVGKGVTGFFVKREDKDVG